MEKIAYKGWQNCYRLQNDAVALVVTADVGPRIIHFGFRDGENEFKVFPDMLGQTGGDEWRIYGGHRLWHAPEARPRTYYPDNEPVQVEQHDGFVRFVQPVETTTGIQKEIDIALSAGEAHVTLTHRLRNAGLMPVELAPWALSVMAPGGQAIVPLPPLGSHSENLLPVNSVALWAYTNMSDPRWDWGARYITLRQVPEVTAPQKAGFTVPDGWMAYTRNGRLFVKTFTPIPHAIYPDFGSMAELFTNHEFLEMETLGPLALVEPQGQIEHVEQWFLFGDIPELESEAAIDQYVVPTISVIKKR